MRSTSELLKVGWQRLQSESGLWLRLIGLQVGVTIAVILAGFVAFFVLAALFVVVVNASVLVQIPGILFILALGLVALWYALYFLTGAYLSLPVAIASTKRLSVKEYFERGRGLATKFLSAHILLGLALLALFIIPIGFVLLLVKNLSIPLLASIPIISVAFIITLVVFAYLIVRLGLSLYVVVARAIGGMTALRETFDLTRGHWWKTAAVLGVTQLIAFIVSTAMDAIGRQLSDYSSAVLIIWTILTIVASIIVTLWTLLVMWEYAQDLGLKAPTSKS